MTFAEKMSGITRIPEGRVVSLLYIMQRCTEDLCVGFVQALCLCKLKVNHLSHLSFAGLSIFRVILLRRQPMDSCLYREMCCALLTKPFCQHVPCEDGVLDKVYLSFMSPK